MLQYTQEQWVRVLYNFRGYIICLQTKECTYMYQYGRKNSITILQYTLAFGFSSLRNKKMFLQVKVRLDIIVW